MYLTLSGRARDCVRDLKPEEIGHVNGVKKITDKLDSLFLKDENTRAYLAFKEFYDYRRPSGVNITDFLVKFEYLYHKLSNHDVRLPEGVRAFFLLTASNVSEENERLARATCASMTYDNMKLTIKKIFGDPAAADGDSGAPSVKSEPVFVAENESALQTRSWHGRGRGRVSRGFRRQFNSSPGSGAYRSSTSASGVNRNGNNGNPVDKNGNVLRCFRCDSTRHLSRFCTNQYEKSETVQDIHITLLNADFQVSMLVKESFGMGVLDSACTKTVTGVTWLNAFVESLSDRDKSLVTYFSTNTRFKFGDGVEVCASRKVKFPAVIGRNRVMIESCVVDNDIPLLLSKASMKKAKVVLDLVTDTASVLGETVELVCSSSGHYCIPLSNLLFNQQGDLRASVVLHTSAVKSLSREEKWRKAMKLHRQFSHASKDKLCKLVRDSVDFCDGEFLKIIEECCDLCDVCLKFKRAPLRPVVGLPLADKFNQVVCMDLKEFVHNESWILHLIDSATRYSAARLIYSKKQDVIVQNIYQMWFTYFGAPRKFLSDNGGEFSNDLYREMNEKMNVVTSTTAGESPFSNGIVERHNQVLAEAFQKTVSDVKCEPAVALAWAVSAKNSLHNYGGFSPNQLVFGLNPNLPSILEDRLPAMEISSSDIIRQNMDALHSARGNYIASESSERIRRALRHNVRSYSDVVYENGDRVYYRRKNFKGWKGPAVVLGKDGQFVLVRHGGAYYRVHPCQLMKDKHNCGVVKQDKPLTHSSVADARVDLPSSVVDVSDDDVGGVASVPEESGFQDGASGVQDEGVSAGRSVQTARTTRPMRNSYVKYKLGDSDAWNHAVVLSKQPKQTGSYKHWVNVHVVGQEDPICVNWDDVAVWDVLPYPDHVVFLSADQEMSQGVVDAKDRELVNLANNKVFKVVPFVNQVTVSSRWVITEKYKSGKKIIKARLVARGFEEDTSRLRKDSPTCSRECLRLVFLTASLMSWRLQSIDITAAFLQGGPLEREVFLRPPSDVCPSTEVWCLQRCIYGLNDVPRSWYIRVKEVLLQLGGVVSLYDNAMFLWYDDGGSLIGILVSHVDDFAFCGNDFFQSHVIGKLKRTFNVNTHESGSFKYLGLEVLQTAEGVQVHQNLYIPSIHPIHLPNTRVMRKSDELTAEERAELKRLSGQMMWVASQTRPDVSFETCVMSNTGKHPTVKMVHEANKALSKLKSQNVSLLFPDLGDPRRLKILAYSDATYASLEDGSSQGGVLVFVQGENEKVAPISWQSKKLERVTKSPLASEASALGEAADAGFLVSSLVQEIFGLSSLPPVHCFTDNGSLTSALETSTIISDRRLRVDIGRLREMVLKKEIVVFWVEGKMQLADSLTKRGASTFRLLEVLDSSFL